MTVGPHKKQHPVSGFAPKVNSLQNYITTKILMMQSTHLTDFPSFTCTVCVCVCVCVCIKFYDFLRDFKEGKKMALQSSVLSDDQS